MFEGRGLITIVALMLAGVLAVVVIAEAIAERTLRPVLTAGWIPGVVAASLYRPRSGRRCARRAPQRTKH